LPALAATRPASATTYPTRPVRIVSPYPPGGGTDVTARLLSGPLARILGQGIVVDNRPGAGGSIGAAEVARAAPDGHTLLVDALGHVVNPSLMRGLPFDYARAFAPVSQLTRLAQVTIAPRSLPPATLEAFVAYAKANRGRLSFGSSGNGTGAQLAAALFLRAAGLELEHVPYRGGSAAMQAVLAGEVAFAFATVNTASQLIRDGGLRAYAVAGDRRVASLPEVPTLAERGFPGCELYEWNGLFAPAGTPAEVVARLHAAVVEALREPAVQERFGQIGAEPLGTAPDAFAAFVAQQREAMARLVRDANITLD
jgi:tripartite-type tricarboxylate transporter receptor subunit TctC